jgi:uncharacterized membrane protein
MKKIRSFLKNNIFVLGLIAYSIVFFLINLRINIFRYNNFDYGKFDLGNMSQMLWNTLHGRFMYLTDYFGTDLPRWAMSHVDPILLLFLPFFLVWTSPLTLVVGQLLLVTLSAFLIYAIAHQALESKFAAFLWGITFLAYPAVGFLTAWTGFHGITVAIPFFLGAFYVFERCYKKASFSGKDRVAFWILLVLTMTGKEQVPLYIFMYGLFILFFRTSGWEKLRSSVFSTAWFREAFSIEHVRTAITMMVVGFVWFCLAFFVIIPRFASYRVEGYRKFAVSMGIEGADTRDVALPNYFLARYDAFGDSYTEILSNMIFNPKLLVKVFFGGDRIENLRKTFEPLGYLPLFVPQFLVMAAPDFLINYGTSAGGVGTAEITNHRVSMIVPIMFISSIYALSMGVTKLQKLLGLQLKQKAYLSIVSSLGVLVLCFYTTFSYNNPVYLWFTQALSKRLAVLPVFAKELSPDENTLLEVGDVVKLSELENKDRECAQQVIELIPEEVSVSGPDYLGAHLSLRETYSIFPALYNEADYVIVDVFSRKLLTILDLDLGLAQDVVAELLSSQDYILETGCGNLFVFRKAPNPDNSSVLPIQERFLYEGTFNKELFKGLFVADYTVPEEISRGEIVSASMIYYKESNFSFDDYIMFTSFVNSETGEIYQLANLPSFALKQPGEWREDRYYKEDLKFTLPDFVEAGEYKLFIGLGNKIRTRSMYLGDITVE